MYQKLHDTDYVIVFKSGPNIRIHSSGTLNSSSQAEPLWTTDSKVLYVFDGTDSIQEGMRYTITSGVPTSGDIPNSGEFGLHKNLTDGKIYFAYNDAGTIKKVELT